MEKKLHLAGLISAIFLIIFSGCFFCGKSEEQRMTNSATNLLANQLKKDFQTTLDNYIKLKGTPPTSFKQLIDESNDPYLLDVKSQMHIPDFGNILKMPIPETNQCIYFYLNGSQITSEVK